MISMSDEEVEHLAAVLHWGSGATCANLFRDHHGILRIILTYDEEPLPLVLPVVGFLEVLAEVE